MTVRNEGGLTTFPPSTVGTGQYIWTKKNWGERKIATFLAPGPSRVRPTCGWLQRSRFYDKCLVYYTLVNIVFQNKHSKPIGPIEHENTNQNHQRHKERHHFRSSFGLLCLVLGSKMATRKITHHNTSFCTVVRFLLNCAIIKYWSRT